MKTTEKQFVENNEKMVNLIAKWQHKKLAKRNAFILLRDADAGLWQVFLYGNPRAKYPVATAFHGLGSAMIQNEDILGWVKAQVRFAERELKKQRAQTPQS